MLQNIWYGNIIYAIISLAYFHNILYLYGLYVLIDIIKIT